MPSPFMGYAPEARGQSSDHENTTLGKTCLDDLYTVGPSHSWFFCMFFVLKNCGDQDSPIRGRIKE